MKILHPPGWPRPKGYSNGISATGRMIFTAGVVGWDERESFPDYTLHGQFAQALRNTLAILSEDGAGPEHVVRMTCYVTDRHEYLVSRDEIGAAWREITDSRADYHRAAPARIRNRTAAKDPSADRPARI